MTYAEDVNYWKTSGSSVDSWIKRIKTQIQNIGGRIDSQLYGSQNNKAGFRIEFTIKEDKFKLIWPVLKPYRENEDAANVQAVTALYHEVKACCVKAKFLGTKNAFVGYLVLPTGENIHQTVEKGFDNLIPEMIKQIALPKPDLGKVNEQS